jgi:NAD+ kinase
MDIYVNQNLINKQRSDGVIISTPTGSTAYAMSNGCPIVSPQSNVMCIVPIAPHSYGQRSVIINNTDNISIKLNKKSIKDSQVTFDGSNNLTIKCPDTILIKKAARQLGIIHPCDYDYFKMLSKKLRYDNKP